MTTTPADLENVKVPAKKSRKNRKKKTKKRAERKPVVRKKAGKKKAARRGRKTVGPKAKRAGNESVISSVQQVTPVMSQFSAPANTASIEEIVPEKKEEAPKPETELEKTEPEVVRRGFSFAHLGEVYLASVFFCLVILSGIYWTVGQTLPHSWSQPSSVQAQAQLGIELSARSK